LETVITKVSHLLLQVSDLDKAVKFYVDFLGFEVRIQDKLADGRAYVSTTQGLGLTTFPPTGGSSGTCDHIAFRCPNGIEPIIEKLQGAGIPFEGPMRTPYGLSVYFRDPDGNRIEMHDSTGLDA
jgi:catechol 2,3-dioxygenase-like lactoylglutathione lyase family enzyme